MTFLEKQCPLGLRSFLLAKHQVAAGREGTRGKSCCTAPTLTNANASERVFLGIASRCESELIIPLLAWAQTHFVSFAPFPDWEVVT